MRAAVHIEFIIRGIILGHCAIWRTNGLAQWANTFANVKDMHGWAKRLALIG
jgi:hypothetical protein